MRLQHKHIRDGKTHTSVGVIEMDKQGFAEVDDEHAAFLLQVGFRDPGVTDAQSRVQRIEVLKKEIGVRESELEKLINEEAKEKAAAAVKAAPVAKPGKPPVKDQGSAEEDEEDDEENSDESTAGKRAKKK